MTIRRPHGQAAKFSAAPRVETLTAERLPDGVPAPAPAESPEDRGASGRFAPGNRIASQGGRARGGSTRLASQMGLSGVADSPAFARYKASAEAYRRAQCTSLARSVGGGVCGVGPSAIIATAAWQLAFSRFYADLFAQTLDKDHAALASKFGNEMRQNELAANELCAREATARDNGAEDAAAIHKLIGGTK